MQSLVEHILEFTNVEERIRSYWILSNGHKIAVPDMREHVDVVIAHPDMFRIKAKELPEEPEDILQLAIDRGAIRVTHNAENSEINIISKHFLNGILDSAIAFAPGRVEAVLWETPSKFVSGTVDEIYNML